MVYRLYHWGERLPTEIALRTGEVGTLQFHRMMDSTLMVRLRHLDGFSVLDNLYEAHIVRGPAGGGLLINGTVTHGSAPGRDDKPQSWYCLVHRLQAPETTKDPLPPA